MIKLAPERLLADGAAAGAVLGIDTGGAISSLGIVVGGRVASVGTGPPSPHGSGLPGAVNEVLEAANLSFGALSAIAVAIGPGSFTGLRIGLSYAKAVAAAAKIAIVGVPSLDALALCAGPKLAEGASVYPLIDARKGEVYTGLYRFVTGALQKTSDDSIVSLASLVAELADDESVFLGYSVAEQARSLAQAKGRRVTLIENAHLSLRGSFVAAIGAAKIAQGVADVIATLEPLYLRPPDTASFGSLKPGEDIHGTPRGRTYPATPRT